MNSFKFSIFICCFLFLATPGYAQSKNELIQKYLKETIDNPNYDKRIAPDGRNGLGSPVDVNVSIYFLDISTLNEQNMEFEAQFYFRQRWIDTRLQYTIQGVDKIVLTNVDKIWTPDLFIINEKEGSVNKVTQPNIFCGIHSDGTVHYSIRLYEKLSCDMDLRNFPHDTQTCSVRIESYGFSTEHVMLNWGPSKNPVSSTASISSFNFDLINVENTANHETFSFGNYSTLRVKLTFKRNAGFFAIRMYTPFVFLILLSWISFWIDPEEKCLRLTLLLIVLYLMITTTSELDRWIPYTPYSKASDSWIGCCQALVFAALLEFIFVAIYFKKEPRGDTSFGKMEMSPLENDVQEISTSSGSFRSLLNQIRTARRGRGRQSGNSNPVDSNSRFVFPIIFVLFNIIYWSIYGSV